MQVVRHLMQGTYEESEDRSFACEPQDLPEEDAADEDLPEAKLPKADVADLRELLRRKDERSGLFSSADAFIPLSDDDEDAEVLEAIEEEGEEEEVVEADGADAAADVPLQTHDNSEVAAAADAVPDL